MMKIFLFYLLLINAAAFCLMTVDKYKARHNLWRIPEATLLLSAALGGSIGALIGMYTIRHKTRYPKFTLGVPAILAIQIALGIWVYVQFFS